MSLKALVREIKRYNPHAHIRLVERAYEFAESCHKGQKRSTGDPYICHPEEVAKILVELKVDSVTIAAALLHDTVEECGTKLSTLEKQFGNEIAVLVEGVTHIDKIHFKDKKSYTAENLRKILLATAKDVRVMLIKLADRLHNMRTLRTFREEKQRRIAQETLNIYAPIAHKLGMHKLKGELEDLSLRILDPAAYKFLTGKIAEKREQREKSTEDIIRVINKSLKSRGIHATIVGRAKYFFSIYSKMKKKKMDFNEVYDLIAIRIITKTIPECYSSLGVVHEIFKPIPGRFKDYIAVPKSNGYQSLHTAVIEGNNSKILEIQIRTEEMHNLAEDGIAAHWRYQGTERDKRFDQKISWLKQLLEWKARARDANDFVETLKLDLFEDEVVVFTPRGDPISLPAGATPVDLAYEVHSNLGERCAKAMVSGKLVPLDFRLRPGDIVEILTNKDAKPSRQWLNFVKTNRARNKIRSYLKIEGDRFAKPRRVSQERQSDSVVIEGKKRPIKIARCCAPKPGDSIVGFPTKDGKITVHKETCRNAQQLPKKRMVKAHWTANGKGRMKFVITLEDRVGVLAEILNMIAGYKIDVRSVHTKPGKERLFTVTLDLVEPSPEVCQRVLADIRGLSEVMEVRT
jgi:guanosine-3',5'-bis(diphosphate) 3'-pyrophosphohydrolase